MPIEIVFIGMVLVVGTCFTASILPYGIASITPFIKAHPRFSIGGTLATGASIYYIKKCIKEQQLKIKEDQLKLEEQLKLMKHQYEREDLE